MPRSLLVPLDGSALAESALPWAIKLSHIHRLPITLLRVVRSKQSERLDHADHVHEQALSSDERSATVYLARLENILLKDVSAVRSLIRHGAPADTILDVADEIGTFAIVMTTHGRGGIGRFLLGSVAQDIAARAVLPILLARQATKDSSVNAAFDRILIPLDGTTQAESAVAVASAVAKPGATLLLHRSVTPIEQAVIVGTQATIVINERATTVVVDEAEAYLSNVAIQLRETGFTPVGQISRGTAAEEILAAARELQPDLIAMATHGRNGLGRWRLGSIADTIIEQSNLPVLLVNSRLLAGASMHRGSVRDAMTRDIVVLQQDEFVVAALTKLLRHRISGAPVIDDDGKLVGVVSEMELLTWQATIDHELDHQADLTIYPQRGNTDTVAQIMSSSMVTIEESAPLTTVRDMFLNQRIRSVPVTKQGRLVGIISSVDVLRAMAQEFQHATWAESSVEESAETQLPHHIDPGKQ